MPFMAMNHIYSFINERTQMGLKERMTEKKSGPAIISFSSASFGIPHYWSMESS